MFKLLVLALTVTAPKTAADREAEKLARQSILEYNVGDFQKALEDATEAYRLEPKPGLLFNLGQCHRALHHWEQAEFFYRGYLREKPDAENRASVEALLREMASKQQELTAPLAQPGGAPAGAPPLAPAAPPTPAPLVLSPSDGAQPLALPQPEPQVAVVSPEPTHRSHALAYTLIGMAAGGVALAAVSTAEVLAYQSYRSGVANGTQVTYADFQSHGNTANVFSALLFVGAGLAVAGAGGAVLTW